jgi:hypothetical protein
LRSIALALLPIGLAVGVSAQDKAKKSSHERLQPGWNTLDLSDEQREKYDRVVREYRPKIDKLESELEALKEKRRKEWHAILTPAQTRKLEAYNANRGRKKSDEDKKEEMEETKTKKTTKKPAEEKAEETKTTTKRKPRDAKDDSGEETKTTTKRKPRDSKDDSGEETKTTTKKKTTKKDDG